MKLNYTFINPNPIDSTAELLLKTFVESNHFKVEKAIESNITFFIFNFICNSLL